jgi:hypothetical protein
MGILSTAAIIAVIAIIIAGAGFLVFHRTTSTKLTAQQASDLVVKDIKAQNPNANVTVISISNSTLRAESWQIVTSVVYNGSKPCPTLFIDVFDYPALGLQNYTANLYTSDCMINGLSDAPSYVISSPEIAIVRSYSSNYSAIRSYVRRFGYANTSVTARFEGQINNTAFGNETNIWLVKYSATKANYSLYATLNQSGSILNSYNVSG